MLFIGHPTIALEKEKNECARDQCFIPCHRQGFDPTRQGITDVIPQVTRILLRARADNS